MEMTEYENEGIMAETLAFTDNHSLLVKKNSDDLFGQVLFCC
jgi:hypothetical protein